MELQKLTCPSCNGSLDMKIDDKEYIFCPYCGQKFFVDNGKREYTINKNINITKNITHTQRKNDDAEIVKLNNQAKEKRTNTFLLVFLWIFCIACLFLSTFIFQKDDEAAKEAIDAGKISAGASYEYEETDYEAVIEQLKLLGFTNITAVDLKDAGLALWKNGKVVSVSIDGDTSFGSSDYFSPDAVVIVTHH